MSLYNINTVNAIDVSNNRTNEINLNDTTKNSDSRSVNELYQPKVTTTTIKTRTTTVTATPVAIVSTMPAATNPMSATVTVLNSNTQFPSVSSDQCSDSEEDFDRTTKNLGAHKWIFNYKDVSSANSERSLYFQ